METLSRITYKKVNTSKYHEIAKVHLNSFEDFFLTSLGEGFLKAYYKACLKNERAIAICALNGQEEIVGFGIGTSLSKDFHKMLLKNNFFDFFGQALRLALSRPSALFRLAQNLSKKSTDNDDGNYAELLSIAVLPKMGNLGVGKGLIGEFEREALKRKCKKIALTTDSKNNSKVIKFYENMGYLLYSEFVAYPNRKMLKLIKPIS